MKKFHITVIALAIINLAGAGCSSSKSSDADNSETIIVAAPDDEEVIERPATNNNEQNTNTNLPADNDNEPAVFDTFESLQASNPGVQGVLEACNATYNGFNATFLSQDSNAVQIAEEIATGPLTDVMDAIRVQWIFKNKAVVTMQNIAIEANTAGGVFSVENGACSVAVFQGFGLSANNTDSVQQFENPSDEILACVNGIPTDATTARTYPLYFIEGKSYGLYRHDYTRNTATEKVTYAQVYRTSYNGSEYFIDCPVADVIGREALP